MSGSEGLASLATCLTAFGTRLGIPAETWAEREDLEQVSYTDQELARDAATMLDSDFVIPLVRVFGAALSCRFLLGEQVVLAFCPDLTPEDWASFREQVRQSPTLAFELRLDKQRLLQQYAVATPGCRMFLYLFPEALERLLRSDPNRLERMLWGTERATKAILVVPNREIWLNGPSLSVIGGNELRNWQEVLTEPLPKAQRLETMYRTCQEYLKWREPWLSYLTPLHFQVEGRAPEGDTILSALQVHFVNLFMLYTADRTVRRADGQWVASYTGASKSVEVTLRNPTGSLQCDAALGVKPLLDVLEWTYDPQWVSDRLPLVQIGVSEALYVFGSDTRYSMLLLHGANILANLQWHWKALIESKVEAHVAQVHALEDYVASVVQAFADQMASLIKGVSDTMLAAVGVTLGSFVAALFNEKFNPTVFMIGTLAYAIYVLIFPLGYNMGSQWGHYKAIMEGFDLRRQRFEQRIYPAKVAEIVGTQVTNNEQRFRRWFWWTLAAYVGAAILFCVMAFGVPVLVPTSSLSASPTAVTTPISSPTLPLTPGRP